MVEEEAFLTVKRCVEGNMRVQASEWKGLRLDAYEQECFHQNSPLQEVNVQADWKSFKNEGLLPSRSSETACGETPQDDPTPDLEAPLRVPVSRKNQGVRPPRRRIIAAIDGNAREKRVTCLGVYADQLVKKNGRNQME